MSISRTIAFTWSPGGAFPLSARVAAAGTVELEAGDTVPAAVIAHETPAPLPPPTLGVPDMAFIVGREQDKTDNRRWVCNGVSLRLLESQAEHERLVQLSAVGLVSLHPAFASLASPFWMTDAEIGTYT